jgi:3-keto-5-aminohexanoate cleavage enzyme
MSKPPYVITTAMVGAETTREQTPDLPITAEEIAEGEEPLQDNFSH